MGKIIAVTSGKGGTGKTTTVAAVASCLAALGHRSLVVDCDIGLRNLDIALGMSDFAVSDFSDVAEGRAEPGTAAREHPSVPGLFFLSAPAYRAPADIDRAAMNGMLEALRGEYEFILLDAPAGIGRGFELAAAGADMAVVVSTCDPSSIRDAARTADELRRLKLREVRLIINRVSGRVLRDAPMSIDEMIDAIGARLLGIVRDDPGVPNAAAADAPLILYEWRGAANGFLDIARRLRGEDIPIK
jgi:septum site-determining protein MinD